MPHLAASRRRSSRTKLAAVAACATLALAAAPSFATILAWNGAVLKIAPPAAVTLGALTSNVDIFAFDERQCFQLANAVEADHGWIAAGTWVSCHFFHADPVAGAVVLDGKARFDADIIDVISSTALLDASDVACSVGTMYPTGVEPNRGLEAFQAMDRYQLLTPRTLQIQMDVPQFSDQLRVMTECCPDGQICD